MKNSFGANKLLREDEHLMAGRLAGKVAFITGVARGQGRSNAIRLAEEGADIIGIDICSDLPTVPYPGASAEDLEETVAAVEALGRTMVAAVGDVRDQSAIDSILSDGVSALGRLDIVSANAGICSNGKVHELADPQWNEMVDINLTGVWRTCKAAVPYMIGQESGGSITITSSTGGLRAFPNYGHYVATKHAIVGLMRTLALEVGEHSIRVNSIHPTNVDTPMIQNDTMYRVFLPSTPNPSREDFARAAREGLVLPIPWVECKDISNALLFLSSDEARYITGVTLPVDAGMCLK